MNVVWSACEVHRVKEIAMTHAFLGDDRLREGHDGRSRTAQDHALDALIVIEMRMQRRHGHIVMAMLHGREPPWQIALVMVVT